MAKDDREVLQNIVMPVTDSNPTRRTLTVQDTDEIAEMYSQSELDAMIEKGVLSGDWKSESKGKSGAKAETDKSDGGKSAKK